MPSITIRGGRKLRRFLERANDPKITAEALARAYAKVIRQVVIPALRVQVPIRTGRLRSSLRVVQRGAYLELRGVFYGRFQRLGPGRDTIAERAMDIIAANKNLIRNQARIELRRALGV